MEKTLTKEEKTGDMVMRNRILKLILFSLSVFTVSVLLVSCDLSNQDLTYGYFRYRLENGNVTITRYTGPGGHITIPAQINGNPVTTIGYYWSHGVIGAFENRRLTSVSIPNSVTTIGLNAFARNQLTEITIPDSVISLSGFFGNKLTSVTIPDSVKTIQRHAFARNQLTEVIISDSVTTIGWGAFSSNQLTSIIIPDSVTFIARLAFTENPLTLITIGADVNLHCANINLHDREAFGNRFDAFYYNNVRRAGIYSRPDVTSTVWTFQEKK